MLRTVLKDNERGVTLIEVMLAGALLTIGLLATASGQLQAINMNKESRTNLRATAVAESMIETIRRNNGNLLLYNGMDTDAATSTVNKINNIVLTDFILLRNSLRNITSPNGGENTSTTTQSPGICVPPVVGEATRINVPDNRLVIPCASVSVLPGVIAGAPDAFTVAVKVAWPGLAGRFNGIVMRTTVRG